jgi:hypothetical protein
MPLRFTILILLLLASAQAWGQLATVYVDATNGSDSFSGANPSNSPSGTGPKATIHAGLDALANNGRLVIFAGVYAGDGIDTDGSPTNSTDNADINISSSKYPQLTTGLTIELRALAGNNEIKIFVDPNSVLSPNGALINHTSDQYIPNLLFNIPGGVLTVTTTSANEYLSLAAAHSSGKPVSGIFLTAGTLDILKGSSVRLLSGATITVDGTAKFLHEAPQKGNDLNVTYTGTGVYTAGSESGYASFGSGVLTINRDPNSSIVFPFPMTFTGNNHAIRILSGSAAFNGMLTLGSVGSPSQAPRTADLIVSTPGVVMFNAPVNLVVASASAADSAISGIDVTGSGTVSFQQMVTWFASYNSSDVSFPAAETTALVWNLAGATITFGVGATFTHAFTTVNNGPATIEARIQNNGAGKISFGGPVSVVPRTEPSANALQQFSIAAINNSVGTLGISGTLRSGLINASSASGGTISLSGPMTLGAIGASTGSLVNAPGNILNLGPYTLTFSGNVGHTLNGSTILATSGGFLVKATGVVALDGGALPATTIDQQSGTTKFTGGVLLSTLTVMSGTCSAQSNVTVSGPVAVLGGTLVLQSTANLSSFTISSGTCTAQSDVNLTGPLSVTGGSLELQGAAHLTSLAIVSGTCSSLSSLAVTGLVSVGGGSLVLQGSANLASLTIASGTCSTQSNITATGPVSVGGGSLVLQGSANLASLAIALGTCSSQSRLDVTGPVSVSGGTLELHGSAGLASLTLASGNCSIQSSITVGGLLSVNGGTLLLADSAGRSLTAGEYKQTGGLFNLGGSSGGDLRVQGNFTLTDGVTNQGTSAKLILIGSGLQVFDPGSSLQLHSLDIANTGGGVRLAKSLHLSDRLTLGVSAKLDLGSNNVILNGDRTVFTNNGSYTGAGGCIVMGGATSSQGGANVVGSEIHAGIGSSFSSITVDVGNANTCSIKGLAPISWNDALNVISGALDIASAVDFRPSGPRAVVVRDVSYASRITTSVGTFNSAGVHHSLHCIGNLLIDYTMAPDLIADLPNTDSLFIDVNSDLADGDGNLATGQLRYFQFPGVGVVYSGSLFVGPTAAVQLEANGKPGESLELSGTHLQHVIRGILKTAESGDRILVSGSSVAITGSTIAGEVSLVGNIAISSPTLCTIAGVKGFTGSFAALARSSVSISMGALPSKQRIQGALTLDGLSFSLAGDLEVAGGIAFNSGTLNFGTNNLQLTTSGDFVQNQTAVGYTTGGGFLVMNRAGARIRIGDSNPTGLPNLQILSNTTLEATGRVTKSLTIGSSDSDGIPTLTLGNAGNDLIFTGSTIMLSSNGLGNKRAIVSDGTTNGTPGGKLFVAGSSVLMIVDGNYSIEELVFNPPSANGTLSILSTDRTPRVLTVSDILTHAGGQIGLGLNHLALTGTGTQGGQRAYNRSDGTIGATSGELRFVGSAPQQFSCGPNLSVPNLRIWNSKGITKASGSDPMTVTGALDLSDGLLTFDGGSLILENGATLIRRRTAAGLNNPISFHGTINVSYLVDPDNGNLKTGFELPAEAGSLNNLRISNPSAFQDSSSVLLDRSIIVGGTLFLDAGQFDLGPSSVTLNGEGAIDVTSGRLKTSGAGTLKVSNYNLTYRESVVVGATNQEFQSGSGVTISRLSIYGTAQQPTTLTLTVNKSVGVLTINAPRGGIEFGPTGSFIARNLSVRDSLSVLSGTFSNTTGTTAILSLSGSTHQVITVDSTGFSLPGGASPIHLQLNNPAGFDLRGGDLVLSPGSMPLFVSGVLYTGSNAVVLSHSSTGQGFDRQGVVGKNLSHIYGIVRQSVAGGAGNTNEYPNGRYEFPTGTLADYRPLAITFSNAYPALSPGTIEVTYVAASPGGSAGLPLDGGAGIQVGSYPNFYWQINSSTGSFGTDQNYDLEVSVGNPAFRISKPGDLRLLLRPSLSPATSVWRLVGSATGYTTSSITSTSPGDTTVIVRVISAGKGFAGLNFLTIGLQSRAPVLVSRVPASVTQVKLNVPFTFKVSALDPGNLPLTYTWNVNGAVVQTGGDSTYTAVFQTLPRVVAVFSNPLGLSDSTVWFFISDAVVGQVGIPAEFALEQNYPNPFNPTTNVELRVANRQLVQVRVFNVLGVEVAKLVNEIRDPGVYVVRWNASALPSGIYLCQMRTGDFVQTRKLVLMK